MKKRFVPRALRVLVTAGLAVLALLLVICFGKPGSRPAFAQDKQEKAEKVEKGAKGKTTRFQKAAAPAGKSGPQHVTVGIYLHHLTQVDLRTNSFLADFYVWFRWNGEIDPTKTFEFRNAVEQWQIVKLPSFVNEEGTAEATTLADGSKYQVFRIEAKFGRPFSIKHFPLDEQDLSIEIEEARYLTNELVYDVDKADSKVDRRIEIPGWRVVSSGVGADEATFETNFGDPAATGKERYTRLELEVHLARPTGGMLVKTVVPLAIVIFITFGVFLLDPHQIDARLTLSVTALVSAVALEFSIQSELPEVGYLVLIDKVYILSYVVILLTSVISIFAARMAEANEMARARRLDRVAGALVALGFVGGTAAILFLR
jgi:hypothetical protein